MFSILNHALNPFGARIVAADAVADDDKQMITATMKVEIDAEVAAELDVETAVDVKVTIYNEVEGLCGVTSYDWTDIDGTQRGVIAPFMYDARVGHTPLPFILGVHMQVVGTIYESKLELAA